MDHQEEYHDPDYPGTSARVEEESSTLSEDEKVEKIKHIVRREFTNELEVRENEIMLIEQRMSSSRRMLHRLRYAIVNSYYRDQKLQLTNGQIQDEVSAQHEPRARAEVSSLLRDGQRRLHPSVRKLLGKKTADLDEILFQGRAPRTKARKDYSAMVRSRNYTIAADTTKSLRPDFSDVVKLEEPICNRPKKVPRHFEPKITNVVTLDEATRNQMKNRYRIIIGNTSKYAPPASRADRSTHKWLLYVRGPGGGAGAAGGGDVSHIVTAVTVTLHHSYAPHHTVHIDKPPFHISRRGWGEFPARVELHFALPERNRPATLEHAIRLDRNYTGLQTLGSETIVDVWLYSTPEMQQYEFKELDHIEASAVATAVVQPKPEPVEPEPVNECDIQTDSWLEFFSKDTTVLDVDEMIIKPTKKAEEKNDLESLIETNVINKELDSKDELEESFHHIDEVNHTEIVNEDNATKYADECSAVINYKHEKDSVDIPNELLIQPASPKKRIMKYIDPTTGKIYYLEMDRKLDLSKVQEIVINSKGNVKTAKISPIKSNGLKNVRKNSKKGGVSLLKPELKSLLKTENTHTVKTEKQKSILKRNYTHIENDHCYLGTSWCKPTSLQEETQSLTSASNSPTDNAAEVVIKKERSLYDSLCSSICRFTCVRVAVNYLLKKIPLICESARDPDFVKHFPFVVENEHRYWRLDFAKRRNIEWTRAKLINRLLNEHFNTQHGTIWRTKQILIYSRLHGFYPIRTETIQHEDHTDNQTEWSSWTDLENSRKFESIKECYPNASDICSLTKFDATAYSNLSESLELTDSDEEIEVVNDVAVEVKKELPEEGGNLTVFPVENEEDRLRFMFIERKCSDIGIELRNEDVGSGYSYSAVHAVLLSAVRSFAEDLVRSALAETLMENTPSGSDSLPPVWIGPSPCARVSLAGAWRAARACPRLQALARAALAARAPKHATCYI